MIRTRKIGVVVILMSAVSLMRVIRLYRARVPMVMRVDVLMGMRMRVAVSRPSVVMRVLMGVVMVMLVAVGALVMRSHGSRPPVE